MNGGHNDESEHPRTSSDARMAGRPDGPDPITPHEEPDRPLHGDGRVTRTLATVLEHNARAGEHGLLGDECARLALKLADRARMHWTIAHTELTEAESELRKLARKLG